MPTTLSGSPQVNRYNSWGQWRPFMFNKMAVHEEFRQEVVKASADLDLQAALAYTRLNSVKLIVIFDLGLNATLIGGKNGWGLSDRECASCSVPLPTWHLHAHLLQQSIGGRW